MCSTTSKPTFATLFLAAAAAMGCAAGLAGRVEEGVYTNPAGTFRVQVPRLFGEKRMRDSAPEPGAWRVSFLDDICRQFIVIEMQGELGDQSLDAWVDVFLMPGLQDPEISGVERKLVDTKYGTAVLVLYRSAGNAPCGTVEFLPEGKHVMRPSDAESAMIILNADGRVYRILYVVGHHIEGEESFGYRLRPVEEVLTRFIDGFEALSPEARD